MQRWFIDLFNQMQILLQNHPQRRTMNVIHNLSKTAIETTKNRCFEQAPD